MNRISPNPLYYGNIDKLSISRVEKELSAGPLSLLYEDGGLRYIKLGSREIIRRIYVAVRDENWNTIPSKITNLHIESSNDRFDISFDVHNKRDEIDFLWRGTIRGEDDGTITFSMDGEALSTFKKNRIGICVLHPIKECAGSPCLIEKIDGSIESTSFPRYISPHQPFLDLKAISHQVVEDLWAKVRFDGDIFETEDQRNWTDASYKTYSTPLSLPFPVEIRKGTKVSQSVTIQLKGSNLYNIASKESRYNADNSLSFELSKPSSITLPRLGLNISRLNQPLSQKEIGLLRALNLSHLRLDLVVSSPDFSSLLKRASDEAKTLDLQLEIALFLSDEAANELQLLAEELEAIKPNVAAWSIFNKSSVSTPEALVRLARRYLSTYDPDAKIGGGTYAWFTELNRNRPPLEALDFVTYAASPQVHAFDNLTLIENLEGLASTIESARQFTKEIPLVIGPITLKPRLNPVATNSDKDSLVEQLSDEIDVRQFSLFGAGWTVGALRRIADEAVYSATLYETIGLHGLIATEIDRADLKDSPLSSIPVGSISPIYYVLQAVSDFRDGKIVPINLNDPLKVDGLALYKDGKMRIILANLSEEILQVRLGKLPKQVFVRYLNERNAEGAMSQPEEFLKEKTLMVQTKDGGLEIELLPFALSFIDTDL
jgi:D-apionolactonase